MEVATIIERKLRSMKVRLFTVPCCSIIPVSSECWKNMLNLLCWDLVVFHNCVFHHISHLYQFSSIIACSIIKFAIIPFYNSVFYVHFLSFFRGPGKIHVSNLLVKQKLRSLHVNYRTTKNSL